MFCIIICNGRHELIFRYKVIGLFLIIYITAMVGNLDALLEGYFELSLIMAKVGNLDGYFELFFIMIEVGNLDTRLDGYFMYFL
jgi:hypothetical protein